MALIIILHFSLKLKYSIVKSSVRVDLKNKRGIQLNESRVNIETLL